MSLREHFKSNKVLYIALISGFIIRIIWVLTVDVIPVSDSNMYDGFAMSIAEGNGYSYPGSHRLTAYWPVGTSAFYGLLFAVFGHSYVPIVIANLIFGIYIIDAVYRISEKLYSHGIAGVASILVAWWPLFIQYTTILASELLFIFLMLLSIDIWLNERLRFIPRITTWSVILCCAVYVRTVALPLFVIFPFSTYLMKGQVKKTLAAYALGLLIAIGLFSPWVIRNYKLFDGFVLVATNSGANLWMGNNPKSSGGYMALPEREFDNEFVRDEVLKSEAVSFILSDPLNYIGLCFKRFVISFKSETIGVVWNDRGLREIIGSRSIFALKVISSVYWLAIFLSSIFGLLLYWIKSWRNIFGAMSVTYLYLFLIPILLVGQDRYHIPLNPFIGIFASYFMITLFRNNSIFKKVPDVR